MTTKGSSVDLEDVALRWPEKFGHLRRIVGLVSSVVELPEVRVEIWDNVGGCHGAYVPSSRLIKLWSGNPVMGLTLIHEISHSLMKIGHSSWDKWGNDPYLSAPEELWARAMTQYVALKTGDRTLNLQLESVREFHWTDEEFKELVINDYTFRHRCEKFDLGTTNCCSQEIRV